MDLNSILVIMMFTTFIALLFTGYPIAFLLAGVSVLFTLIGYLTDTFLGTGTGLGYMTTAMFINRIYRVMESWILVALPMFVYMGLMLDRSGIAEKMMHAIQELFGKVRGGLAVTVTLIGIILAASTGIIGASVVLLALLSLPAMLKQGYSHPLAAGTVCASGTLGILIPPSVMLVMMADQLALSVGDLFIGALIPGIILGLLYITYILIFSFFSPSSAPLDPNRRSFGWKLIWAVFKSVIPPGLLILSVLGSIFLGMTTPTEASGIGAFGATLLAWYNKRLTLTILKDVLYATFETIGYIFAILISANCFALVLRILGGDEFIEGLLTGLPLGPYGILAVILGAVFFLGFFLDWIEITFIILPLLAPAVAALNLSITGYGVIEDPKLVWFAVLVAVCLQTSFLTPPVGFAIFYLRGACPPEIKLIHIYKGVVPFIILQLIGLMLIILWPQLVLWLPAIAYK